MSIDPYAILSLKPGAHIHVIGVCGTGMSAFAKILLDAGFMVSGSDLKADPPTGPLLAQWGVKIHLGYDATALAEQPDVVVVGNAVSANNPVAKLAIERGLPCTHMPAALHMLLGNKHTRIVIAGTHGKSTTSAVTAWILLEAGLDPGWLIGAVPYFGPSGRLGKGPVVIEGDEYNSAFFDQGAKFFHYRPNLLGITTVEFDHVDLYPNLAAIEAAFSKLVQGLPPGGLAVLADDASRFADAVPGHAEVLSLNNAGFELLTSNQNGVRFRLLGQTLSFPLPGRHGAIDAAMAAILANRAGASWPVVANALSHYPGLKLRQEVLAEQPVRVIRDFGHHPTEIAVTLSGLRDAWPKARIVAVFEPRSYTSRTDTMRPQYEKAFEKADRALFAPVFNPAAIKHVPLDTVALAKAVGPKATACTSFEELAAALAAEPREGLVVFFSNGTMNGLPEQYASSILSTRMGES